jgi:hypothetical protein
MFIPSVTVEQEAASRRPMFAPALLRSRAPRKGGFSVFWSVSRYLSVTAQASRQTVVTLLKHSVHYEQTEHGQASRDHP